MPTLVDPLDLDLLQVLVDHLQLRQGVADEPGRANQAVVPEPRGDPRKSHLVL